jgi:hypothetical protein
MNATDVPKGAGPVHRAQSTYARVRLRLFFIATVHLPK